MTNAEKLAKDTEELVRLINNDAYRCRYCISDLSKDECRKALSCKDLIKRWLESEVEEDGQIQKR